MPLRLLEVFLDRVDELVVLGGLGHLRQSLHQLLLRVVHITQLLDEQFVERADCGHRVSSFTASDHAVSRCGEQAACQITADQRGEYFSSSSRTLPKPARTLARSGMRCASSLNQTVMSGG